ncbi:hypothetical protein DFR52_102908 [Hoeflea marina]|uniref:Prokaryotic STING domain-containing protein n=2 Tax=Hoeflea marina TaxID=274592 RepID=A0A317PRP5_9HYPH|nr:hypothetical protein DFR52_102908 [Hoeflea marina]
MSPSSNGPSGLSLAAQLQNLISATQIIAEEINEELGARFVQVTFPPRNATGLIDETIFEMLDNADAGIFDMSGPVIATGGAPVHGRVSPNVMYELTWLHALGTPTIPVIPEEQNSEFYLSQLYARPVPDYTVDTLVGMLRTQIRYLVHGDSDNPAADPHRNPISKFYNLSIVDIASSNGLATGYYHNFLRYVLDTRDSPFLRYPNADFAVELSRLVIFRPETIGEVEGMNARLNNELGRRGAPPVETLLFEAPLHSRKLTLKHVGSSLIDIPTPISSLAHSPRYRKARRIIPRSPFGDSSEGSELRKRKDKLEKSMIDSFFRVMDYLLEEPGLDGSRIHVRTIDEFLAETA